MSDDIRISRKDKRQIGLLSRLVLW